MHVAKIRVNIHAITYKTIQLIINVDPTTVIPNSTDAILNATEIISFATATRLPLISRLHNSAFVIGRISIWT